MEIRNNTPSFGMAFIKPNPELMSDFSKYVTKDGKVPVKRASRAVRSLIARHANDKHFDMTFVSDKISVAPKSEMAKQMMAQGLIERDTSLGRTPVAIFRDTYVEADSEFNKSFKGASNLKKVGMLFRMMYDGVRARISMRYNPETSLPKGMRSASANVSRWEAQVEAQAQKEAKIAEQLAKKEQLEKNTIAKLDSVFENKK